MRGRSKRDGSAASEAQSRYEPLDVPPLLPLWLACLLAAFVGAVLLSIELGYPLATHQQSRGPLKPLPPPPQLESAPRRELQAYEAEKRRELGGKAGTVPIEVAMRQTAKQGWGPPK